MLLTTQAIHDALERYQRLESGWSWDLAYYNQWCWALTHGNQQITVRPIADYATEGPSVWKTNYLAPIRYAILPIYYFWPDPKTLLIIHAIIFWWAVPAAFALARFETRSNLAALIAVALVAITPFLLPLAANDFRELQLGIPFFIVAAYGVRARRIPLAILGVAGLLACRQEFALAVASLAILPPRAPQSILDRQRWAASLWFAGLAWVLVVFFGYLVVQNGWGTPAEYLGQFIRPRPALWQFLLTALEIWILGLGAWAPLALASPRAFLLSLPWLWSLAGGRWGMHLLATTSWHHVRYAGPFVATSLAAGILGGARLWRFASLLPNPNAWRAAATILAVTATVWARQNIESRLDAVPAPFSQTEVSQIWNAISKVGPNDAVLAHYDLAAPLSSRDVLLSYVMKQNQPKGFPDNLPEQIRWVFFLDDHIKPETLLKQGFIEIYSGQRAHVFARPEAS